MAACKYQVLSRLVYNAERVTQLQGGESDGLRVLESFTMGRGSRYHREMSSPNTAFNSCSRLSPYLTWGCISMRTIVQRIRDAAGDTLPKIAARPSSRAATGTATSCKARVGASNRISCV